MGVNPASESTVTGAVSTRPWGAFRALVHKDLVLYLANRRALVMGLLAPIAIAAFFGYLFEPKRAAPSRIPVAISDLDGSALSKQLVAALAADSHIVLTELPEAESQPAVVQGRQRAAIVLPAGLGSQAPAALFGAGVRPQITIHYDPSQGMVLPVVNGLLSQHLMAAVGQVAMGGGAGSSDWMARLRDELQRDTQLPEERRRELHALFDGVARVQQMQAALMAPASGAAAPAAGGAATTAPAASGAAAASAAPASAAAPAAPAASPAPGLSQPFKTREVAAVGARGQP